MEMKEIIKLRKKGFEENLEKHGCGYWSVCDDHGCPCAIDESTFDNDKYQNMVNYINDILEEEEDDF